MAVSKGPDRVLEVTEIIQLEARESMTSTTEPLLLLVDDNPVVLRVMARHFSRLGVRVLVARDAGTAEGHLKTWAVTHVICDYDLGAGQPRGTDLMRSWRAAHGSIVKACLYTGSGQMAVPPEVDCVFHKPADLELMMSALEIPVETRERRHGPSAKADPGVEAIAARRGSAVASRRR